MKYSEWIDRQAPSPALTHKLLHLRRRKWIWPGLAAAACCALAVGLLLHRDASAPSPTPTDPPSAPQLLQPVDTTPPEPSQTLPTEPMPDITYDADDSTPLANSLKHPDGWFQEPLTQAELESLLGPANWWQEAGQSLTGSAYYDGTGSLYVVEIRAQCDGSQVSLSLSPGQLPPSCLVAEEEPYNNTVWGTPVQASEATGDWDGDGQTTYVLTLTFLRENTVGARLKITAKEKAAGQALAQSVLAGLLQPDRPLTLEFLQPEEIPQWRSESLTWQQVQQETEFLPYVPQDAPGTLENAYRELGQGRDWLRLSWDIGSIIIYRIAPHDLSAYLVQADNPAAYDLRLYSIPHCDSVPAAYWQTVDHPIFHADEVTLETVQARAHETDDGRPDVSMGILYPDGTLVQYYLSLPAEDAWQLIQQTL